MKRKVLKCKFNKHMFIEYPNSSDIDALIGECIIVCVSSDKWNRNDFCTQISIKGKLEAHPDGTQCRVLLDNDMYTYFHKSEVTAMGKKLSDNTMVLYIEFQTRDYREEALNMLCDEISKVE